MVLTYADNTASLSYLKHQNIGVGKERKSIIYHYFPKAERHRRTLTMMEPRKFLFPVRDKLLQKIRWWSLYFFLLNPLSYWLNVLLKLSVPWGCLRIGASQFPEEIPRPSDGVLVVSSLGCHFSLVAESRDSNSLSAISGFSCLFFSFKSFLAVFRIRPVKRL